MYLKKLYLLVAYTQPISIRSGVYNEKPVRAGEGEGKIPTTVHTIKWKQLNDSGLIDED